MTSNLELINLKKILILQIKKMKQEKLLIQINLQLYPLMLNFNKIKNMRNKVILILENPQTSSIESIKDQLSKNLTNLSPFKPKILIILTRRLFLQIL